MSLNNFKFKNKNGIMTLVEYLAEDESVVIPDEFEGMSVTVIGKEAFISKEVKEVVFPKHLELIEASAFFQCTKLKTLKFQENFKELKKNTFENCTSLEEVEFPASMEKVPALAFVGCTSLRKVTTHSENTKIAPTAFGEGKALEEVSFHVLSSLKPPLQTRLMVSYIRKFNTLSLEEQTELNAFIKKKSAVRKELFLLLNADIISYLFGLKTKLKLDEVDAFLESSIASNNTEVTAMFLDYKNKHFSSEEKQKFDENKELVEIGIELPTLKQFKAKWKCSNVEGGLRVTGYKGNETHETIPKELAGGKTIVAIGELYHITLGSITSLKIDAPIKTLDGFRRCINLQELYLPETIEETKKLVFHGCKNLKTVNVPKNIKIINEEMFKGCESLEEIIIPDSVETIGLRAFYDCKNLQKITMKNPTIDISVFKGCSKLADKQGLVIVKNVVYDYIGTADKVIVPEGVVQIGHMAFRNTDVKEVILPQSLVKLTYGAFEGTKIESIIIPESVTEIPNLAFAHCSELVEATLSQNLISILDFGFSGCTKLENIKLPKSLKSIGGKAFNNCINLSQVTGLENVELDETTFLGCDKLELE